MTWLYGLTLVVLVALVTGIAWRVGGRTVAVSAALHSAVLALYLGGLFWMMLATYRNWQAINALVTP